MKRKWMVVVWALALAVFLGVFWYQTPYSLGLDAGSVSRLVLTDGGSGLQIELTDQEEIAHVVENLNSITLQREGAARESTAWRFSVTVYRTGEAAEDAGERYLIDDPEHVRTGGFRYTVTEGRLDDGYWQALFRQAG